VTLYLDLGFNDQGEMIPFQGGTNEEVVHKMYRTLNYEGKGAEKTPRGVLVYRKGSNQAAERGSEETELSRYASLSAPHAG
jgi:hypothetical protein